MQCRFKSFTGHDWAQCEREARKGWTTCDKHYSAGMNRSQWAKLPKNRQA